MREEISLASLSDLSAEAIIEGIIEKRFSVLETFGAKKLKQEMKPIGAICGFFLRKIARHTRLELDGNLTMAQRCSSYARIEEIHVARRYALKLLSIFAPTKLYGFLPEKDRNGVLVIGFNHPTLGEIFRLLGIVFEYYLDEPVLFPVNLPWYEAIAPYSEYLRIMNVFIVPIITPSTDRKMASHLKSEEARSEFLSIKRRFSGYYVKRCQKLLDGHGGIIPVAPSATRQTTIFPSKLAYDGKSRLNPVMGLLATKMVPKSGQANCGFLPLLVIPPKAHNSRLNLFRKYQFHVCGDFGAEQIQERRCRLDGIREFDRDFLRRLAIRAIQIKAYDLVYPKNP